MIITRRQLRKLISESMELEFQLPNPTKAAGVPMNIRGKTTVTFARSASARNRFAIISDHPFTADGTPARKQNANPLVTYEHYLFETKLGGSRKQIEIDPCPHVKRQKFRVKSYSSR